jgi:hypothetical protein
MFDHLFEEAKGSGERRLSNSTINLTGVLSVSWLCLAWCLATPVLAAAPMVKNQAPGFYRLRVGNFEVTVLSDGTNMLGAKLLQGDTGRIEEALKRNYLGDSVETSHNCFLVNTGSRLVLIDTGAGSLLGPSTGYLLRNLRASGYRP